MFEQVVKLFILLFTLLFVSTLFENQYKGITLEEMWNNYSGNTNLVRLVVKIFGILFICWVASQNYVIALFLVFLFIFLLEYDYHNELDKQEGFQNVNKKDDVLDNNRLHKNPNKYDYFVAERNVTSKPSGGADKKLFKSTQVDPYGGNKINEYNY